MTEPGEREVADTEEVEPGIRRQAGQAPVSTSLLLSRLSQKSQYQLVFGLRRSTMMCTK